MITGRSTTERRAQQLHDIVRKAQGKDGRELQRLLRSTREGVLAAFSLQRFAVLNRLGFTSDPLGDTDDLIVGPITDAQRRAFVIGADRAGTTEAPSLVTAYLAGEGVERIAGINAHTRTRIEQITEKNDPDELMNAVYEQGDHGVFSPIRATTIAFAEVYSAVEAGHFETRLFVGRLLGVAQEKHWDTAGDNRVDPDCQSAQGDGWIPIDQTFSNGLHRPLSHPHCRCSLSYRSANTILIPSYS